MNFIIKKDHCYGFEWSLKVLLLMSVFFLNISTSQAGLFEIYNDNTLFEKGRDTYKKEQFKEAALFLYAYIQRSPLKLKTDNAHRKQIREALKYSLDFKPPVAGTIGLRLPPPSLDELGTNSTPRKPSSSGLIDLLKAKKWQTANRVTWRDLLSNGDVNGDLKLGVSEIETFPCANLKRIVIVWKKYYGSSAGFNDLLIPLFRKRFISCGIWRG